MRVTLSRSGGLAYLPGLSRPITLETSSLDAVARSTLEQLVKNARFRELPSQVGSAPPGAADYRTYEITVEDESGTHTVKAVEPIGDPALQSLVNFLEHHGRAPR
jgi:hypothetical protein